MIYFLAITIPFLILMLFGPFLIKILKKLNFGQQIRGEGPESHYEKKGIPTMGGILIILAILITSLFLLTMNIYIKWALFVTIAMAVLGFFDDIIKIKNKRSLGLKARYKITGQIFIGLVFAYFIYLTPEIGDRIIVPFIGQVSIGRWIILLVILTVTGTANAVNITDGLDGLAAGVTVIVISSFSAIAHIYGFEQLGLFGLIVTGACIGFMWYNSYPAQVFMGDLGSLALGGAISVLAVITGTEFFLLIIGGIFVIETLSVMIQVIYFKLTGGNRVFKMTPLHHHFELDGLEENKIVIRFLILSLLFAAIGLLIFYYTENGFMV